MFENNETSTGMMHPIPMRFGSSFLQDYAYKLLSDPEVAVVEIVSNCWDAGADRVDITWSSEPGGIYQFADNGTGMTYDEFTYIWSELSYNRADEGKEVTFPAENRKSIRKIFGRSGKGRLSLFCFNDEYTVETAKNGEMCRFVVTRHYERGRFPFEIQLLSREHSSSHRTVLSGIAYYNKIATPRLIELLGSKFVADPAFEIYVNNALIELTDLNQRVDRDIVITPYGNIDVYLLDSKSRGRTSQQHGVAWWVNKKSVGKQGWEGPNGNSLIDARFTEAWRYTFIVIADILEDQVEYDWTRFIDSPKTQEVLSIVTGHIQKRIDSLFFEKRRDRRNAALHNNRERLKGLPSTARQRVGKFIDDLQLELPTLKPEVLDSAVAVFANLEQARTGYKLLDQLAELTPNDIDKLTEILDKWSIHDAQIVLEELERRLRLIEKLDGVVDSESDELHVIHPLIKNGLWLFGPEYESVDFRSNRGLANVIRTLIGDKDIEIDEPRRRPDFVATPNGRIGAFARENYDLNGQVTGLERVLVVEIKRGGFTITTKEMRQAEDYALAISASGNLTPTAKIVCYVLGTTLGDAQIREIGENERITIIPRTYRTIIDQAHARTFNLKHKIEEAKLVTIDPQIDSALLLKTDDLDT